MDAAGKPKQLRTVVFLFALVVGMFAFGFALVPLYKLICSVAGINNLDATGSRVTLEEALSMGVATDRIVNMEFDATVNGDAPFKLTPITRKMSVTPGKVMEMEYQITNLSQEYVVTQSVPSVTPWQASEYLKKVECFCFTQQPLQAGESKKMLLRFSVDPELPKEYSVITLSYTLMDTKRGEVNTETAMVLE